MVEAARRPIILRVRRSVEVRPSLRKIFLPSPTFPSFESLRFEIAAACSNAFRRRFLFALFVQVVVYCARLSFGLLLISNCEHFRG